MVKYFYIVFVTLSGVVVNYEDMKEKSMDKTPEELFKERQKRVLDAMHLKVPDRVPIITFGGFFAAKYAGFTFREAMYDREKAVEATLRYLQISDSYGLSDDSCKRPVIRCERRDD